MPLLRTFIFTSILFIGNIVSGQEEVKNINPILSIGWGGFLNSAHGPVRATGEYYSIYNFNPPIYSDHEIYVEGNTSVNAAYVGLGVRWTLLNTSKESSISLFTYPMFGFGGEVRNHSGFGTVSIPLYLEMSFGAGSTLLSEADKGTFIGLGLDADVVPLIPDKNPIGGRKGKIAWVVLSVETGYRWWSVNYKLREIKLQLGMGKKQEYNDEDGNIMYNTPYNFKVSYIVYLNY